MTEAIPWSGGTVSAAWDRPDDPRSVLVLGHGAGGNLNDTLLQAVARALCQRGVAVLRFNFPYREAGRKAPGSQAQSENAYRAIAEHARVDELPLFCGGKSYGGRIATHIAADGCATAGLVLLSYPWHPPGRPQRLRDAHLGAVDVPLLFVQGTGDPFATPDLLERAVAALRRATLVRVEGGDHSLRVRGRPAVDVVNDVVGAIDRFISANAH